MQKITLLLSAVLFSSAAFANCAAEAVSSLNISSRDGLQIQGDAGPPLADGTFELLISLRTGNQFATVKVLCSPDDRYLQQLSGIQYQ